ncbi:glycosyltransferase family 2 protein [Sulfurimonas microaerophilic]|uniref:glycosyltransferase family 2 protein n=1 Tax=Sulfurimonas microaerophilic TaxID=3058392 RepID=UPI0027148E5C|nr:glycosyltransferase family 2 protein [Sulfurimonas sp. hsl 1-7]
MLYQVNASIVLYHNKIEQLKKTIESFLATTLNVKLYLVDNSSNDDLKVLKNLDERIEYIFNNSNLGYGSAHNIAMRKSIDDEVPFHLVLNPDIYFSTGILEELFEYMQTHQDVGNTMPQVKYPNGTIQYLAKLLPTPKDLVLRRFIPFKAWKDNRNRKYELRESGYNKIMNIPNLSGCFMFLRTSILEKVGLFDENIFMYLEDTDLNRRIHKNYKTIFYPKVEIVHEYAKESYVNKKLLLSHIKSAIYYFNKWGWFFDKERKNFNEKIMEFLKQS